MKYRYVVQKLFEHLSQPGSEKLSGDNVQDIIVKTVSECSGFPIVIIELYDDQKNILAFKKSAGLPFDLIWPLRQSLTNDCPFDLNERTNTIFSEIHVNKRSEPFFKYLSQLNVMTVVSAPISCPMILQGKNLGALTLATPQPFDQKKLLLDGLKELISLVTLLIAQKTTEDNLRRSTRRLKATQEVAKIGHWERDLTTNVIYWSEEMYRILGMDPRSRPSFKLFLSTVEKKDLPRLREALNIAINERKTHNIDFNIVRGDKQKRFINARATAIYDETDKIVRLTGTLQDITERKQAREKHRKTSETLKALYTASPIAIMTFNSANKLTNWNPAAEKLFGWKAKEVLGKTPPIISPENLPEFQKIIDDLRAGKNVCALEIVRRKRDGSQIEIALWNNTLLDDDGNYIGSVAMMDDITGRKRHQRENAELLKRERDARAEAESANQAKDLFLATLSHELRTPLTAMLTWSQLIRCGTLSAEKLNKGLEVIEKNARSQAQLIEDLFDISRIISGKILLQPSRICPNNAINLAIESIGLLASEKKIEIIKELAPGIPAVHADATRLQQILWNLLGNSIKFTPSGGKITIKVTGDASSIQIIVSDNGIGIEPEYLPHIFNRFSQADGTMTRRYGGLGLGLAICNSVARIMGGTLHAESLGKGKGSTFTLSLPIHSPSISTDAETKGELEQKPNGATNIDGLRILYIEDNAATAEALTMLLNSFGAQTQAEQSAQLGFKAIADFRPDIIISDISMPGEDGYKLISRIRDLSPEEGGQTPAIALTAFANPNDVSRALTSGFQKCLSKPVDMNKLIETIVGLASQ